MASETNTDLETTVVEVSDVTNDGIFASDGSVVQSSVGEPSAEEFVVVELSKDGSEPATVATSTAQVETVHTTVASSASSTSVATTDPSATLATAQSASMAIEEATRVLTAAGIDASSMPQVITQLVQLTQQQQLQQGQQPPTTSQQAANQAAILQALALATQQTSTTLVSSVPAAVQTVVLSANGAQQPQVAGRIGGQALTQEAASSLAGKLQSPLTIQWLLEHFEMAEGMSLPRYALFTFYLDFCSQHGVQPVNAASFGKVIRQVFPIIKTRRLGTRGQSKYHYYGIGVKSNSPYHSAMVSAARRQPPMSNKTELVAPGAQSTESKPPGQPRLSGFPDVQTAELSEDLNRDKVSMFLMMYRAHCQSILDSVVRSNFGEVENFIIHFWSGMPEHLLVVLESETIANVVGVCDSVLYKAIISSILPPAIEPLSLNLTHSVRNFAKQLTGWITKGCTDMPESLQKIKHQMGFTFTGALRRRTSVSHLAQATRSVLQSQESVQQMLVDWKQLDLTSITYQSISTFKHEAHEYVNLYVEFMLEFEDLLEQQANVESFASWLGNLVERCILQPTENEGKDFQDLARNFLLRWQFFTTRVVRDLTLRSAPSFGSYHLLSMLFEDYILFLLEKEMQKQKETVLQDSISMYFTASPDLPDDDDEDEEEEEDGSESRSPAMDGACLSAASSAVSTLTAPVDGGAVMAASTAAAASIASPATGLTVSSASSQNIVVLTSSMAAATSVVSVGSMSAPVDPVLTSSLLTSTAASSAVSVTNTDTALRPQELACSPPAKRSRPADDDDDAGFLAEASGAQPQCTTPEPLMRSIGVGAGLPLDVSTAALIFPPPSDRSVPTTATETESAKQ
ncbi:regulatory factor X 4-like [Sycon ciliatum]|uniref:regulatory factor X 4-like n=1 Tax=Sycon ciliatum TaxID=27933 RepID=UPI0031F716D3